MKSFLLSCILAVTVCSASAQGQYRVIDETVAKLGALPALNVTRIADTITAGLIDKEQQARAIFFWIATNIAIDPKAVKQKDEKNILPEKVIELRKANAEGFSLLYQEMASRVNIRCLSVDGYLKLNAEEINEPADEVNHSWNVVQLGQSPETWYFVDAFGAAGILDKKMTTFTPSFTSQYFFADRKLFNLTHLPDNDAWQLGGGPKSVKDFYALPLFGQASFAAGLQKATPAAGYLKIKTGKAQIFSLDTRGAKFEKMSIISGEDRKAPKQEPLNFEDSGGVLTFTYTFKKDGTFPVKILGDGKDLVTYMAEVAE